MQTHTHAHDVQEFLNKYSDSKHEFSDSAINFGRHKILECAREIFEKSQDMTLDKDSFIRISDDLEVMLIKVGVVVEMGGCGHGVRRVWS